MYMDREQETYVHSRKAVEARIEEMITLLDMIDDDPDLEEDDAPEDGNDAELCLGWNENVGQVGLGYPTQDGEMSLGWGAGVCQAGGFLNASRDDREEDAGDEREFDLDSNEGDTDRGTTVDDEPSLGSLDGKASQLAWAAGGRDDRELADDTQEGDQLDEHGESDL